MKKNSIKGILVIIIAAFLIGAATSMYNADTIEKIKITIDEVPDGFMFGQVPEYAQGLLKGNPWKFDQDALKRFTGRIYDGADYNNVSDIHMTIIAKKDKPTGNAIGCYIIIYKNAKSANDEFKKLGEFVRYSTDRAIVIEKNNLAVYLYANDVKNYDLIKRLSEIVKKKLELL